MHPSQRGETRGPRALKFTRLRYMELENAVMDSSQISEFISKHKRTLVEFNFEDVKLRHGDWDDALAPLTVLTGNDNWKNKQEEVMDIPIMLSPVELDGEPRVMGQMFADDDVVARVSMDEETLHDEELGPNGGKLTRWLSKGKGSSPPQVKRNAKESFLGSDHMKRFLRGSLKMLK